MAPYKRVVNHSFIKSKKDILLNKQCISDNINNVIINKKIEMISLI